MPSTDTITTSPRTTAAAPDSLQMLWELAGSARQVHLAILAQAIGQQETAGSCMYASVHLASLVNRFSAWRAQVLGGNWVSADGTAHGHYWVHAQLHQVEFVLDITADQFGQPDILVLPIAAAQAWQPDLTVSADEHIAEDGLEMLTEKAPSVARGMQDAVRA